MKSFLLQTESVQYVHGFFHLQTKHLTWKSKKKNDANSFSHLLLRRQNVVVPESGNNVCGDPSLGQSGGDGGGQANGRQGGVDGEADQAGQKGRKNVFMNTI